MKIGLIIYGPLNTVSGGYLYDRKLVEYLQSQGDSVDIISLPWREYGLRFLDNLRFRLPPNFDLLLEDELNHPSLLAANAARHLCPIVSIVHNLRSAEPRAAWRNAIFRAVEERYLKSVDGFIFNSIKTRESVQALNVEDKPYVIATPGGDRLGGLPPERILERAAEPGRLRLLFLANVTPLKGLHVLLKALSVQPAAFDLDVVGSLTVDAAYADDMRHLTHECGLQSIVAFRGGLEGRSLVRMLERAQVIVIPSYYEGFGIAYLEGMAFGLPAIGSTAGAIPQLISHGKNGYLVAPGDSEMLVTYLLQLATNRELLARMSLNALQRYQSQPTWRQSGEIIRAFLLALVGDQQLGA